MKKFSIIFICYLLLPNISSLITTASSYIKIWPLGTTFEPANSIELLSTLTAQSFFKCATICNINVQCRTFVYNSISKQCILYEGDVSTGRILFNSTTSKIGSIKYFSDLYRCYNKTLNQCSLNRYLVSNNSSNAAVCPINTYWNGTMCLNQVYFGTSCNSDIMCRNGLGLECDAMMNQTCSIDDDANLVRNGGAEIGSCVKSTGGISPAFWTSTGLLTQLFYNYSGGAQNISTPGPSNRGNCYFYGGDNPYCYMYQIINLTIFSYAIDQNKVSYNFSAWLGGWESQDDFASLLINFYNSNNVSIGNVTIAPVHPVDRLYRSQLLYRQNTGTVPINTRSIKIVVEMTATTTSCDASVDNISFKLRYIP